MRNGRGRRRLQGHLTRRDRGRAREWGKEVEVQEMLQLQEMLVSESTPESVTAEQVFTTYRPKPKQTRLGEQG